MRNLNRFFTLLLSAAMLLALGVTASAGGFTDVPADAGYAEAVRWASDQGYINGYGDGRFGVSDNVTRAQLATILYRAAGSPDVSGASRFSDVAAAAYYTDAAVWAERSGLINGYPDGRFGVDDPVTRQQAAVILWRWAGSPDASAEDYADESGIADYAQTAEIADNCRRTAYGAHLCGLRQRTGGETGDTGGGHGRDPAPARLSQR